MTIPKYLYHYTSQKGLLGILKDNKLRMTNILYLNDSSEFSHTVELVKTELKNRKKLLSKKKGIVGLMVDEGIDGKMFDRLNFLESLLNEIFPENDFISKNNIYVFSLSKEHDDLNQWRGYCPKEGGFCIGFDSNKLLYLVDKNIGYEIRECKYCKIDGSQEIVNLVDPFVNRLYDITLKSGKAGVTKIHREFLNEIIRISPYIKNDSFQSESEIRVIYRCEEEDINFHEGKSMIIPHVEFSPVDDDNKLPISKIIVGPTPHPELSKLSIENLLQSKKYKGVEVDISDIPYRSW
jgi:hypothetical protein